MARIVPKRIRNSKPGAELPKATHQVPRSAFFLGAPNFLARWSILLTDILFALLCGVLLHATTIQVPGWFTGTMSFKAWIIIGALCWALPFCFMIWRYFSRGYFVSGWIYNTHWVCEDGEPPLSGERPFEGLGTRWSDARFLNLSAAHEGFRNGFLLQWTAPVSLFAFWLSFASFNILTLVSDPQTWERVLRLQGFEVQKLTGTPWTGIRVQNLRWNFGGIRFDISDVRMVFTPLDWKSLWQQGLRREAFLESISAGQMQIDSVENLDVALEHFFSSGLHSRPSLLSQVQVKEIFVESVNWKDSLGRDHRAELKLRKVSLSANRSAIEVGQLEILGRSLKAELADFFVARAPLEIKTRELEVKMNRLLFPKFLKADVTIEGAFQVALNEQMDFVREPTFLLRTDGGRLSLETEAKRLKLKAKDFVPSKLVTGLPPVVLKETQFSVSTDSKMTMGRIRQNLVSIGQVQLGRRLYEIQKTSDVWGRKINEDHPLWTLAKNAVAYLVPVQSSADLIAVLPPAVDQKQGTSLLLYLDGRGESSWSGPRDLLSASLYGSNWQALDAKSRTEVSELSSFFQWKVWEPRWIQPATKDRLPATTPGSKSIRSGL